MDKRPPGLFISGTDTDIGKTYVACLMARHLRAGGLRVGVYKPAASGCRQQDGQLVADDAAALWQAAGAPGLLEQVCLQRFAAPLAPVHAARLAGGQVDRQLLRTGLDVWLRQSDLVLVEGAGGLLSPLSADDLVADLAAEFGFPLILVSPNRLGTVGQTLAAIAAARQHCGGCKVAGVVLNRLSPDGADDPSRPYNAADITRWSGVPVLADLPFQANAFPQPIDWLSLAQGR